MNSYYKELLRRISQYIPRMTITNWSGFTNQPAGDGIEIISDSASDTGLCTIWSTDNTTGRLKSETVTLLGASQKATLETNWGNVYGVFLGDQYGKQITRVVGTVTIREASANQTITTITAGNFQKGMAIFNVQGKFINISNYIGVLYWSTIEEIIATSLNCMREDDQVSFNVVADKYIYLISDDDGATTQIAVMEG